MNTKSFFFLLLACITLQLTGCSKNDDDHKGAIEPTQAVLNAFNEKYPDAEDAIFKIEGNYFVVDFTNGGASTEAWFTDQGQWMMDKADTPFNRLPSPVISAFNNGLYAGWEVDDTYTIRRDSMGVVYKIEAEKGNSDLDLYYSQYGNLIKAVPDDSNEDVPILIPYEVHVLMNLSFATCTLLDIQSNSEGYLLNMLDGTVYKIAQLNKEYRWQSTTYQITKDETPAIILEAFQATGYANDSIQEITILLEAAGTFYTFTVDHNGQSTTITFDALGNIIG